MQFRVVLWKPCFLQKFLKILNCNFLVHQYFIFDCFHQLPDFSFGKKGLFAIVFRTKKMYSIKGLIRAKLLGSGQFRRVKAPERTIGGDLRGWYIYDHGAVCHLLHNRADSTLVKSIKPTVRGCSTAQTRDKSHAKICFQECTFEMGG